MATGNKKSVVMAEERAAANGIATLGSDGLLASAQRPKADGLYMPDGTTTVKEAFDGIVTDLSQIRRDNQVIAVNTVNGLTTTVYSNDVTVTISILGKPTEAISTNTALCGMLPERYRPPIDYYVRSFFDDGTSNVVGVAHSGYVTNPLADIKAGSYHRAIFTYSI